MNMQAILDQDQDLAFSFEASAAPDKFSVVAFEGTDELFDCYEFTVELASHDPDIDLSSLVDSSAVLTVHDKYDRPRYFHGVIAEAEAGDTGFSRSFYSVVLKPTLHRLQYISDSRIFQDQNVQDIVSTILQENGVTAVDWRVAESHQTREYCVQYSETSYDFIRRILAEEGLFFWFEHSQGGHMMIISDAPWSMPMLEHAGNITYNAQTGGQTRGSYIRNFKQSQRVRATDMHQKDYTFKRPKYGQDQKHSLHETVGESGSYELYDYPGRYKNDGTGKPFTQYKMEAERVTSNLGRGETNNIHLCSGYIFTLEDHPNSKANTMHRILEVRHKGTQYASLEEDAPESEEMATRYDARFTTMPQRIPYRPTNPNPKPQILGSQIATVTGPAGEEIYCDEHGRIKVKFPWDRHNEPDENSSCWIRVTQNWAGGSWGHIAIPRIGQEIVVDFLEGDPDQPIVTGRTYHATNKSPYTLPAHKTKMVIRSDSHKAEGYNEISFEDEGGQENISLYAQKDQTLKVLNNRMKRINNHQVESVGANKSIDVGNNHVEKIGGSMKINVGGGSGAKMFATLAGLTAGSIEQAMSAVESVGNPMLATLAQGLVPLGAVADFKTGSKNRSFEKAGKNRTIAGADQVKKGTKAGDNVGSSIPISGVLIKTVEKAESDTIGIARTEQIGLYKNTMVGHTQTTFVGWSQKTSVGLDRSVSVGNAEYKDVGTDLKISAGETFSLTVGKSSIVMNKDGIIILKGVKIQLEGDKHIQAISELIDLN